MAEPSRLTALKGRVREAALPLIPDEPVVVALSGGADSAACAWVATQLAKAVKAVFVDHGFAESSGMRKAAEEIARQLEVPLAVVEVTIGGGSSPEAQARTARYRALLGHLEEGEWLLTGHTADDQAETVLLNLFRGSGSRGVRGIPVRRGSILRPLLAVGRAHTRELASLLGLAWRDDPTNADTAIIRNAIRRDVLPELAARFNPRLREALVRTATLTAQDDEFLTELAAQAPVVEGSGTVRTPRGALIDLPIVLASRVARDMLSRLFDHPGSQREVQAVLATANDGRTRTLAGGAEVALEGPFVALSITEGAPVDELPPGRLDLPGVGELGEFRIEAWVESAPPIAFPLSPWTAVFDAEVVGADAVMRAASAGDSVAMRDGHKLVKEALAEAKVPRRLRDRWPVLISNGDIWWVPGVRLSQRHWVTGSTRRYLWVSAERESA